MSVQTYNVLQYIAPEVLERQAKGDRSPGFRRARPSER